MGLSDVLYAAYARRLTRLLDPSSVPRHVGVILDGNRRWAGPRAPARARATGPARTRSPTCWTGATRSASRSSRCGCSPPTTSPPGRASWTRCCGSSRRPSTSWPATRPLADPPGRRARPAAGAHRAAAQGRRGRAPRDVDGHARQRRGRLRRPPRDRRRGALAAAGARQPGHHASRSSPRCSTSSTSPSTSTPRASPTPTWSSAPRASSGSPASCSGRARTRVLLLRGLLAGLPQGRLPARAARLRRARAPLRLLSGARHPDAPSASARDAGPSPDDSIDQSQWSHRPDGSDFGADTRSRTCARRVRARRASRPPQSRTPGATMASSTRPAPPARPGKEPRRTYVLDTSVLLADPRAHRPLRRARGRAPGRGDHRAGGQAAPPRARATSPARRCGCSTTCASRHGRLDAPVPIGDEGGTLRVELNHTDPPSLPAGFRLGDNDTRILAVARNLATEGRDVTLVSKDLPMRVKASALRPRRPRSTAPSWRRLRLDRHGRARGHRRARSTTSTSTAGSERRRRARPALPHRAGAQLGRAAPALARVSAGQAAAAGARRPRRVRPARPLRRAAHRARPAARPGRRHRLARRPRRHRQVGARPVRRPRGGAGAPPAPQGRGLPAAVRRRRPGARLPARHARPRR